ncbi:hypothetical protein [Pseudomonas syringae]|uniref:hypothetical protein n=1 Tax=Pseudomonas syringae TaxID=317 RepID=UPI003204D99D
MSKVKERPILFSAPMVRAILSGQKTVTRRALKVQPHIDVSGNFCVGGANYGQDIYGKPVTKHFVSSHCPYGQPGDRLWLRETWYCDHLQVLSGPYLKPEDLDVVEAREDGTLVYAADGLAPYEAEQPAWKPSIHMPRWASRILLEITDVRVERLQEGDGETAFESRYVAEGIHRIHHGDGDYYFHPFKDEPGPGNWSDPFDAWRELWVSINGAESWNANPWVWVVEFKRVTP